MTGQIGLPNDHASRSEHRTGVMLVAASAVAWSISGVFARGLSVDAWTAVSMRAAIATLYMLVGLIVIHRRNAWKVCVSIGQAGIVIAACSAVSMIAYVAALFGTSIANVAAIYATTPFLAAMLGWFVLGEKVSQRTLVAAGVALVGVAMMVGVSFGTAHLAGDAFALVMAFSFAVVAVLFRARPSLQMLPTNLLCCIFAALVSLPFASPASVPPHEWFVLAAFAFFSIPLAFFMFLAGARRIPAAEAGLICTIEVVLSPLWVYLLFGENPGGTALVGGFIVIGAVVWHILASWRPAR